MTFSTTMATRQHQLEDSFFWKILWSRSFGSNHMWFDLQVFPGVYSFVLDSGEFGGQVQGHDIIKPFKIMTDFPGLRDVLERRLTPEERSNCAPIEGSLTSGSQAYPEQMCRTILGHLREYVKTRNQHVSASTARFSQFNFQLMIWASGMRLWSTWRRPLRDQTEGHSLCNLTVNLAGRFKTSSALMPSRFRRYPDRLPEGIPSNVDEYYTRAAFFFYNDETKAVEVEDLGDLQFPRQRFSKPVRYAIFEPEPSASITQSRTPTMGPNLPTDIDFPDLSKDVPQEVRSAVARLHLNLGHPSRQELNRLLAYEGNFADAVYECARKLRCSTCKRLKPKQPPRPTAQPSMVVGQFGDELQMDIFYCKTLASETFMVSGMVDRATGLHQAIILPDRNSETTFDCFEKVWLRPFGLPIHLSCDPDKSFRGSFERQGPGNGLHHWALPSRGTLCHWDGGAKKRSTTQHPRKIHLPVCSLNSGPMQRITCCIFPCNQYGYSHSWSLGLSSRLWQTTSIVERQPQWSYGFGNFTIDSSGESVCWISGWVHQMWGLETASWVGLQSTSSTSPTSKDKDHEDRWFAAWPSMCILALDSQRCKEAWWLGHGTFPFMGSLTCWKTSMVEDRSFNNFGDCRAAESGFWFRRLGSDKEDVKALKDAATQFESFFRRQRTWPTTRPATWRWWVGMARRTTRCWDANDTKHGSFGTINPSWTFFCTTANSTSTTIYTNLTTSFWTTATFFIATADITATISAIQHRQPNQHQPDDSAAVSPIWHSSRTIETTFTNPYLEEVWFNSSCKHCTAATRATSSTTSWTNSSSEQPALHDAQHHQQNRQQVRNSLKQARHQHQFQPNKRFHSMPPFWMSSKQSTTQVTHSSSKHHTDTQQVVVVPDDDVQQVSSSASSMSTGQLPQKRPFDTMFRLVMDEQRQHHQTRCFLGWITTHWFCPCTTSLAQGRTCLHLRGLKMSRTLERQVMNLIPPKNQMMITVRHRLQLRWLQFLSTNREWAAKNWRP